MDHKPVILVFLGNYLPGFKSGGPLRTIVNLVDNLSDEFEFLIITSDRDLGETSAYPFILLNEWQDVGRAKVYYISPDKMSICNFVNIIKSTPHDLLYFNSFFNPNFTIKPLIANRFFNPNQQQVIVAPRGEFSSGALSLKSTKKYIYLMCSKLLGLYRNVIFQASTVHEEKDIIKTLKYPSSRIKIAIDLPEKAASNPTPIKKTITNINTDVLSVVFLSRISPMKNLDFAIQILNCVDVPLVFDIYGPLEDLAYWLKCQALIEQLPKNVKVNYCGSVEPSNVKGIFSRYDLFLFPTLGENYGHVIAESLSVGTPVLLSDQTPWRNLEADGLGWDLPLHQPNAFVDKIGQFAKLPMELRQQQRLVVQTQALKMLFNPKIIEENCRLFYSGLKNKN
ncbi:MAG: glycosyltransferase [Gammaproteobacteria bacterium]|nr:glycosyltransferase [Gammaproteobacteria bacterium]